MNESGGEQCNVAQWDGEQCGGGTRHLDVHRMNKNVGLENVLHRPDAMKVLTLDHLQGRAHLNALIGLVKRDDACSKGKGRRHGCETVPGDGWERCRGTLHEGRRGQERRGHSKGIRKEWRGGGDWGLESQGFTRGARGAWVGWVGGRGAEEGHLWKTSCGPCAAARWSGPRWRW